MSALVTRKGQVTIPKELREYLQVRAGSRIDFEVAPDGRVFMVKREETPRAVSSARRFGDGQGDKRMSDIMALLRGER